jgi:phosphoglycolate phosphatase-like HAD superfamily hydrolase
MKAVIFDLDALVQKGTPAPLPGMRERLAALRAQGIPIAIATNPTALVRRTSEQEEQAPDSVTPTARMAANIKEMTEGLGLQQVPWFISLGDQDTREAMSSVRYHSLIERIKQELETLFPGGELFVSEVIGPAPAMLLAIAHYLQVEPREGLYVGDEETDRQASEAAGMPFEMGS